jgi:flagellar biosynthesis protein FlhF
MASMNLKTFRAPSMAQALAEVKKDLGSDAVILHTRAYKAGGVMGMGAKSVVEITAADSVPPAVANDVATAARNPAATQRARTLTAVGPRPKTRVVDPHADPHADARADAHDAAASQSDQFSPATFGVVARASTPDTTESPESPDVVVPRRGTSLTTSRASTPASSRASSPAPSPTPDARAPQSTSNTTASSTGPSTSPSASSLATRVDFAPVSPAAVESLRGELAAIKSLVGQVLRCTHAAALPLGRSTSTSALAGAPILAGGTLPENLLTQYLALQTAGVPIDLAESVIGAVRDELDPSELADPSVVAHAAQRHLARALPVVGGWSPVARAAADAPPRVIALVGPTGVGKTTTVAKLAATLKLRQNRRVALITSDTYRIAAVDQLRTYATIIGLPLKVAMTPDDVADAVASFRGFDAIILDTAGRSQHDRTRLSELRALVDAARPDETHLVLAASTAEPVLLKTLDRFSVMAPDRLIISKLDEAVSGGVIAALARAAGLPISYITTGQEVPDHIEPADAHRLARFILTGAADGSALDSSPTDAAIASTSSNTAHTRGTTAVGGSSGGGPRE